VVLTYLSDKDSAARVVDACRLEGAPSARALQMDLNEPTACGETVTELIEELGPPTTLVVSAGRLLARSLEDTTVEDFADVLNTNCVAPFAIARAAGLPMRKARRGSITFLSSVHGCYGVRARLAYATSKAGLIGMTKALSVELAPHVRVNAVVLGTMATDMTKFLQADPVGLDALESRVPLARLGQPEEVAAVVAALAHEATFVTGAAWEVDGGTMARLATPSGDPIRD
jgi:NAD(P)-dependent dehydrogenase (short-subunit alcohol dehydrogenase family)